MSNPQKHISDLLRAADKEIKNENLHQAMAYINKIYELEPRNVYAKAYRERIISLFEAQGMARKDAELKATNIQAADIPASGVVTPTPPLVQAKEPAPVQQTNTAPAAQQTQSIKKPEPKIVQQVQQSHSKQVERNLQKIQRTAASSEAYRTLLMDIWKDGAISTDEQHRIDSMRDTFAITQEEHIAFEKEVRIASYMNAVREDWKKGITDFEPIRKKFKITDQEQIAIEPKVFQLIQSLKSNGSVLILDDEKPFLEIVKGILSEAGYYCFTAMTGEEGLHLLETMTPDIVVCDINFSKPHMSGFAFYEKFRAIDKFLTTPFIFLSGLDQDVLIRTGKKLGADDYLLKPVDTELLLATIEGKLRRSRELKRAI